jgi:soluble lytic murein transglycosylase-like protein/lipopolysaccharide biosynthesis regulator YciM
MGRMYLVSTLLIALFSTVFESSIDRAFTANQNSDWTAAASALDQALNDDAQMFQANNFHYLRGRIAENQNDWARAREEFNRIGPQNPLRPLALWHSSRASIRLHDEAAAEQLLADLPKTFPADLKMQIAREAGDSLALKIYEDLPTREGRLERAKQQNDIGALWGLLREAKNDDVALECARLLISRAEAARDLMDVAQAFVFHRQFEQALPLYERASMDHAFEAEARYQTGRTQFQLQNYSDAIETYRSLAQDFEGTQWQKDAEYQIASCFWRIGDYRNSEKAYLEYIRKYGSRGMEEDASRNLVDIYRVLGENQKGLQILDRMLMKRLSPATRQVFLFTKAKILYAENRYAAALALFQQLGQMKLRPAPGAATADEVEYFQALCQSKLGNNAAAERIWQKLARDEFSYYGQRSAEKLGRQAVEHPAPACVSDDLTAAQKIEADLAGFRHPLRGELDFSADPVSELVFLHLWDEAAFWMERSTARIPPQTAAEIAYLGGRYNRSISYADRLGKTESTLPLLYPAGYRQTICNAAVAQNVDPLWLHAIIWQESKYNPNARSGAAARGLMQFIPETARAIATAIGMPDLTLEKLYDPSVSIQLGARYWSALLDQLKSPEMALAAYNGGIDNVEKWKSKSSDLDLFVADIGFVETKKYVMSVFAARAAYGSLLK